MNINAIKLRHYRHGKRDRIPSGKFSQNKNIDGVSAVVRRRTSNRQWRGTAFGEFGHVSIEPSTNDFPVHTSLFIARPTYFEPRSFRKLIEKCYRDTCNSA